MNNHALSELSGWLEAANQTKRALKWLEARRAGFVSNPGANGFAVDHQGWGSKDDIGFKEANMALLRAMEHSQEKIVDDAIAECHRNLATAKKQIEKWAAAL